jgi:hypothetical protein
MATGTPLCRPTPVKETGCWIVVSNLNEMPARIVCS